MKIEIPDYLLEAALRHYEALAAAYRPDGTNNRAHNARRVAPKEIARIRKLINDAKSTHDTQHL